MTMFKDQQPADLLTLEMRVSAAQRKIMQHMVISEIEQKQLLDAALERAVKNIDLPGMVVKEAEMAIMDAIRNYFSYGEGHRILRDATHKALNEAMPQLFKPREA